MGSGSRQERITFGATMGQARAMLEYEQAMIPIERERAEMQLEMQKKWLNKPKR